MNKKDNFSGEPITLEVIENAYKHIMESNGRQEVPIYLTYEDYQEMMEEEKYRKLFGEEK